MGPSVTYRQAGVDIIAGKRLAKRIGKLARSTSRPEVLAGIGGFGALFQLEGRFKQPVLVSSTDGVGTKLKLAFALGQHHTVGIDLVAMCVNDILVYGAQPLFFLDYFSTAHLDLEVAEEVISGMVQGCRVAGCALVGGETAEMPGFYRRGEYDLAGFVVGVVEKEHLLDGSRINHGDAVIGLASNGLHSNGFSLVRKILFETHHFSLQDPVTALGCPLAEELLKPTRIYTKILELLPQTDILGMAHITGGGLIENLPRVLPPDLEPHLDRKAWEVLPIFQFLREVGQIAPLEMYRTFNMGIGLGLFVKAAQADRIYQGLQALGETPYIIGEVVKRRRRRKGWWE